MAGRTGHLFQVLHVVPRPYGSEHLLVLSHGRVIAAIDVALES